MERAFVGHMARTGDAVYAATKAGYATPENRGPEKARQLRADVVRQARDLIISDLVPLSIEALRRNLKDTAPGGVANNAAKLVLGIAFGEDPESANKDPSDMTLDEIVKRADALERERIARAKDITPSVFD